jgi:HlyD family secretion protein
MRLHRHWGIGLTALALAAALVWGFMPRPVTVDIARVQQAPLRVTVEEEGRTRVIDRYVVSAPVAGYAQRITLRVGDAVEQCQTLVELEPLRSAVLDPRSRAEAEARVAAAQSAVLAAEQTARAAVADAQIAQKDYERRKALFQDGRVSREEHDRAEAAARRAEATRRSSAFAVEVARHELEAAQTALQYSAAQSAGAAPERVVVQSPVAGRVLRILRESEGVVASGQALIELGDPNALEVEIEVLSADAVRIQPGMTVEFSRWGGPGILEGRVRVVEPTGFTKVSALGVEEQRVLVIADIVAPAEVWARLGDGYRVEAEFILWEGAEILQVPASALFRHGQDWAVFAVDATGARGCARSRSATTTVSPHRYSKALAEGDTVVAHPSDLIADGVRVTPR